MRPAPLVLLVLSLAFGLPSVAASAVHLRFSYTDELSKCLVNSTTAADKTLLVEWMFATASLHPAVQSVATVSDSTRDTLNRALAGVVQRLLTVSCKSEARLAIKYEGNGALEASFGILGQVAARELFGDPKVSAGVSAFGQYMNAEELQKALQPADSQ